MTRAFSFGIGEYETVLVDNNYQDNPYMVCMGASTVCYPQKNYTAFHLLDWPYEGLESFISYTYWGREPVSHIIGCIEIKTHFSSSGPQSTTHWSVHQISHWFIQVDLMSIPKPWQSGKKLECACRKQTGFLASFCGAPEGEVVVNGKLKKNASAILMRKIPAKPKSPETSCGIVIDIARDGLQASHRTKTSLLDNNPRVFLGTLPVKWCWKESTGDALWEKARCDAYQRIPAAAPGCLECSFLHVVQGPTSMHPSSASNKRANQEEKSIQNLHNEYGNSPIVMGRFGTDHG